MKFMDLDCDDEKGWTWMTTHPDADLLQEEQLNKLTS
jgi:hypothetical protein